LDDQTPLFVLGARRAVEIARRARGGRLAEAELQQAESKLAELEQIWPQRLQNEGAYVELARDVMRLAERARSLAMERTSQKGRR
jgi:cob(I)alamin adenosyltransferase